MKTPCKFTTLEGDNIGMPVDALAGGRPAQALAPTIGAAIRLSADRWCDDVRLSDIEPRFACTAYGKRGADVRPHFLRAKMGTR